MYTYYNYLNGAIFERLGTASVDSRKSVRSERGDSMVWSLTPVASLVSVHQVRARVRLVGPESVYCDWVGISYVARILHKLVLSYIEAINRWKTMLRPFHPPLNVQGVCQKISSICIAHGIIKGTFAVFGSRQTSFWKAYSLVHQYNITKHTFYSDGYRAIWVVRNISFSSGPHLELCHYWCQGQPITMYLCVKLSYNYFINTFDPPSVTSASIEDKDAFWNYTFLKNTWWKVNCKHIIKAYRGFCRFINVDLFVHAT